MRIIELENSKAENVGAIKLAASNVFELHLYNHRIPYLFNVLNILFF